MRVDGITTAHERELSIPKKADIFFFSVKPALWLAMSHALCMSYLACLSTGAPALADQPGSLELKQVLINLAVDCAVVAAAAFGFNLET